MSDKSKCKNCKHWSDEPASDLYKDITHFWDQGKDEYLNDEEMLKEFGYLVKSCGNPKLKFYERPEKDGACVVDGSEYMAKLITAGDFSCANFEYAKEIEVNHE